jgi:acetolactate synthase regulatory subunit
MAKVYRVIHHYSRGAGMPNYRSLEDKMNDLAEQGFEFEAITMTEDSDGQTTEVVIMVKSD